MKEARELFKKSGVLNEATPAEKLGVSSKGDNPFNEQLLKQYDIKGVPTIVFLDVLGVERNDLRLVDFFPPDKILVNMSNVKQ